MIPLRDVVPSRAAPRATLAIIAALVLVFLATSFLGDPAGALLRRHGLTAAAPSWEDALSAPWLHASALSLLGQLTALWLFGPSVEDRLAHGRYVALCVLCAFSAALVQVQLYPTWPVPAIGAGGAIAGVVGAYLALYPASKILVFAVRIVEVPAMVFAAAWCLLQVIDSTGLLSRRAGVTGWSLIALAAACGTGVLLGRLLGRRERAGVEWFYRDPAPAPRVTQTAGTGMCAEQRQRVK
jgi:membrane associated rhomboid family serine protease